VKDNKGKIESLFKKMLKDDEVIAPGDEIYQKDMKDIGELKVQWKICGILGYQIYEKDKISYKFGEKLEKPDISLVIRDSDLAVRFLKRESFEFDYGPGYKGGFRINYTESWKIIETGKGKKRVRVNKPFVTARFNKEKEYHPFILSKLPIFRSILTTRINEDDVGFFIPINQSLGTFEKKIMPVKVFEHFINKASNIVILNKCGCRVHNNCQKHDHSIGCMNMGDDTLNLLFTEDRKHVATKEEALELVKKAVDNGLIPLLGRAMDEAAGAGVEDTGKFMSACFCCPCCCVDIKIVKHGSSKLSAFLHRIEGLNVVVDEELCVGCGDCIEACVWNGMEMIDDKAHVNEEGCLGCGRCETSCPNDAISITLNDSSDVDALIDELESHVTVD
jgi:UDP-glucose 4-epimerase